MNLITSDITPKMLVTYFYSITKFRENSNINKLQNNYNLRFWILIEWAQSSPPLGLTMTELYCIEMFRIA